MEVILFGLVFHFQALQIIQARTIQPTDFLSIIKFYVSLVVIVFEFKFESVSLGLVYFLIYPIIIIIIQVSR